MCVLLYDAADEKETKREERELNELQKMSNKTTEIRVEMSDKQTVSVKKNYKVGRVEESVTALNKKPKNKK